MTQDEILALARKCGFDGPFIPGMYSCNLNNIQTFVAAIAEECAKLFEDDPDLWLVSAPYAASVIRAAFPAPETKP